MKIKIDGSILDRVHKSLDPHLWEYKEQKDELMPFLKPDVKNEVLKNLFSELQLRNLQRYDLWIKNIYLMGSLVTLQFVETSDIDVLVLLDEKKFKEENPNIINVLELGKEIAKTISGKYYDKTLHVINFYFQLYPYKIDTDAYYDLLADKWIKFYPELPEDFNPDIFFRKYKDKSKEIMELINSYMFDIRNSLIDVQALQEILAEFDKDKQEELIREIRGKISKIEEEILELGILYDNIKQARDQAFLLDKFDDSGFFAYKFSSNWLPANVVYKFLERYFYIDLLKKIKKIIAKGTIDITDLKHIMLKE